MRGFWGLGDGISEPLRFLPEVTKILSKVVDGTPSVENYDVANSTFHKIASPVSV
jgi:hypothetical protein